MAYRSIYNNTLSRTGSVRTIRPGAFDAGYTRKTFLRRGRGIDAVNFPTFFGGVGGFGGYGFGGLSPYSLGQVPVPPYFALHPPVYYSAPVPRSYGYSPYAYPGRIVTPEAPVPVVPEVIDNAFCPAALKKLEAQEEDAKEAAKDFAATQEWIQNPVRAGGAGNGRGLAGLAGTRTEFDYPIVPPDVKELVAACSRLRGILFRCGRDVRGRRP